ncbi:MAG: hypothetical protein JXN63_03490 [Candidatus Delongbacteria bacterium]|nr:hypothetical protein [Candidatus Delongbacteria bacterium]
MEGLLGFLITLFIIFGISYSFISALKNEPNKKLTIISFVLNMLILMIPLSYCLKDFIDRLGFYLVLH